MITYWLLLNTVSLHFSCDILNISSDLRFRIGGFLKKVWYSFQIDKAREASYRGALTQSQLIDEIEKKIQELEKKGGPKK